VKRFYLSILLWGLSLSIGFVGSAHGFQATVRLPLDLDDDPTTGCAVVLESPGSSSGTTVFDGAEMTLQWSVDAWPDPPVTADARLERCPALGESPTPIALDSGVAVAVDQGFKGSDAVPLYVTLEELGITGAARFAVEVTSDSGSSDLLIEAGGAPLTLQVGTGGVRVPGVGGVGGALIALANGLVGVWALRKRKRAAALVGLLLVALPLFFTVRSAASSAGFMDAFISEQPIARDDLGDSKFGEPAADITAVWAVSTGDSLLLRLDIANVEISRCRAVNASGDPGCDGLCDLDDDFASPDCDGLCAVGELAGSADCDAKCGANDAGGSPDCNGLCGSLDNAAGPDCDGVCSGAGEAGSWDCNNTCDIGEEPSDTDCEGACDAGDAAGGPDCDGTCGPSDPITGLDCDGACGVGDPLDGGDCDQRCDAGDVAGSVDCDGTCAEDEQAGTADCDHACDPGDSALGVDCDGVCNLASDDVEGPDCDLQFCTPGDSGPEPLGCDGICQGPGEFGSPDCNGLCEALEFPVNPDCNGVCEAGEPPGSADCDQACDVGDDPEGGDCDASCGFADDAGSADCEGVCDLFDDATGPDCVAVTCSVQNPSACNGSCEWHEGGTADCNGACEVFDQVRSADCDGVCDPGPESAQGSLTPDCNGWCSVFDPAESSDCDGTCDQFDEGGSPDCPAPSCNYFWNPVCGPQCTASTLGLCDQVCGANDAGQDCDGVCDPGDFQRSRDCDGWCQSYDHADGPDCDEACWDPELASSSDCNGVCEVSDSPFGADCDEVCDPEETPSSPDCARDVRLWLTSDAAIDQVWIGYGTLGLTEGVSGPVSWSHSPSPYLVETSPHVFSLVEQPHTLAFRVIDDGAGRAFMAAIVDADGTVLARTGDGQFRVTSVEPTVDWVLPEFDDSSWSVATPCSYVAGDWETPGNGFRSISDPYGAARVWEGDTCSNSGGDPLWIRVHF